MIYEDNLKFEKQLINLQKENYCLKKNIKNCITYLRVNTRYSMLSGMIEFYGDTEKAIKILGGKYEK